MTLIPLECVAQNYEWGKKGSQSLVGRLFKAQQNDSPISESAPFAEFWMGTHPNGPSKNLNTKEPLFQLLKESSHLLGENVVKRFEEEVKQFGLPFLFKVLSINQALSIQAHPDKSLAKILHEKFPKIYKDPNHKPELCCALTDFEAFCGFLPIEKIYENVKNVEELQNVLGKDVTNEFFKNYGTEDSKILLKKIYGKLMKADKLVISENLEKLIKRLQNLKQLTKEEEVIIRLNKTYPGDVGCFSPYFLNIVNLKVGEAIFCAPNEPHCYLNGECIEIMANSDNVVRAGLTPKFIDADTLLDMLTYNDQSLKTMKMNGIIVNEFETKYVPPVDEFMLTHLKIPSNQNYEFITKTGSIMLVIEGEGNIQLSNEKKDIKFGNVFFIPSNTKMQISSKLNLSIFIASCNHEKI